MSSDQQPNTNHTVEAADNRAGFVMRLGRWAGRHPWGALLVLFLAALLASPAVFLQVLYKRQDRLDLWTAHATARLVNQMEDTWNDPKKTDVRFDSEFLCVLTRGEPRPGRANTQRFSFGMNIDEDPIGHALAYAPLLALLESRMESCLGDPVRLDLVFFKSTESAHKQAAEKKVDFQRLDGMACLKAKKLAPKLQLVASEESSLEGVTFARTGWGIRQLADLNGRSMAFAHTNSSVSFWAKVHLARAGVTGADLGSFEHLNTTPYKTPLEGDKNKREDVESDHRHAHAEVIQRVLAGEFHAGEATVLQFHEFGRGKLLELKRYPLPADLIVARPGLETNAVHAFQQSLLSLKSEQTLLEKLPGRVVQGYLPVQENFLADLRQVLANEAARFVVPNTETNAVASESEMTLP